MTASKNKHNWDYTHKKYKEPASNNQNEARNVSFLRDYKTKLRIANTWISAFWSLEQKNPSPPRLNNVLISAMGWQNVSVRLCVHMKTYTKGCAGMCALDVEARGLLWVSFFRSCPPYFLRQVISLVHKTHQLGQVCLPEKPRVLSDSVSQMLGL